MASLGSHTPSAAASVSLAAERRELRALSQRELRTNVSCGIPTNSPEMLFVSILLKGANAHIIILKVHGILL